MSDILNLVLCLASNRTLILDCEFVINGTYLPGSIYEYSDSIITDSSLFPKSYDSNLIIPI